MQTDGLKDSLRTHRRLWIVAGGLLLVLLYLFALDLWRSWRSVQRLDQAYREARAFLTANRPVDALRLIEPALRQVEGDTAAADRWLDLEIGALESVGHARRLAWLYKSMPARLAAREKSSLIICRAFLQAQDLKGFAPLRSLWKSKQTQNAEWLCLDADAAIVAGKPEDAVALLKSCEFTGAEESSRLIRLAMLALDKDVDAAWEYLATAHRKDPQNAMVRLMRAQIEESRGHKAEAQAEYQAARDAGPKNPLFADEYAEFFRRQNAPGQALRTWAAIVPASPPDFIWLKAWFWSHVTTPLRVEWHKNLPRPGMMMPLVDYLLKLAPNRLWDTGMAAKMAEMPIFLRNRQETYWLRLLQALKDRDEKQACDLLQTSPFRKESWAAPLELGLYHALLFRRVGRLTTTEFTIPAPASFPAETHTVFVDLERLAAAAAPGQAPELPADLVALLKGDDCFAGLFMAAGWTEAALWLRLPETLSPAYPEWVAYGFTQALRASRGPREALAFAQKQKPSPALEVLTGELLLALKQTDPAMAKFAQVATADSPAGFRAAWLLTMAWLDRGEPAKARDCLARQPRLAEHVLGKELAAKLALAEGHPEEALRLYRAMVGESIEAKVYLAKTAFAAGDVETAETGYQELDRLLPGNPQIKASLDAIRARKTAPAPSPAP